MRRVINHVSRFLACAWLALIHGACGEPVPGLPLAPSASSTRAALTDDLLEGSVNAYGIPMPAQSSVKRQTRNSMTVDVPTDLKTTEAYLSARLAGYSTERRKGQVTFLDASPAADGTRRLEITLRATSLTTEVTFVARAPAGRPPTEDPSRQADDAQTGLENGLP